MATTVNTYRNQVQWASGLNLLAGIWLFISAFVIDARGPMTSNNLVCGIVVVVLAAIRAGGAYEAGWLSWLNALLGVWVVISPWGVMGTGPNGPTQGMILNNCITGGVVIVLALWSALSTNTGTSEATSPEAYPGTPRPSYGR